jgi:curved DNA-binding protein CbpA
MLRYDPKQDAYAILGVDPAASQDEVETAYRRAALTWHPDKSPAPDAAERFQQVIKAARILRDPVLRRDYDHLRRLNLGRRARPRPQARRGAPQAYVPMRPPPGWLADRVRIHFDAVLLNVQLPQPPAAGIQLAQAFAFIALGMALVTGQVMLGALAVVMWGIGRVARVPPHQGVIAWAKIVPGRKVAEYHSLNQRIARYESVEVPFDRLFVAVVGAGRAYRIQIEGFPHSAVPVLHETRDFGEARRCAREAGRWLELPLERAA